MKRPWLNFIIFFPLVIVGVIGFQFWPEFQRMSVEHITSFLQRPGIKVSGVSGDPIQGFHIKKIEVSLPVVQFEVEGLELVPTSWIKVFQTRSLIFERVEIDRLSTHFHSLLSLPEHHITEVHHFFQSIGAKRVFIRKLEMEMPLTRTVAMFPDITIENWVAQRDNFSVSEFTIDSPQFRFRVADLGTRIQGEFKSTGFPALARSIPVRLKIHSLPGRRGMIWSFFDGQVSGEYDPFKSFDVKASEWAVRDWFKSGPPISAFTMDLKLSAEDFGGRFQIGSILMALLSDAVDMKAQFRLGGIVYQNEAIQILGVGPKAMMLKKMASASQGHFKPSSFVFRSTSGRHHEALRLLPQVFGKKTSTFFEFISPNGHSLESTLSMVLFQKDEANLNPPELQVLEESLPFFSWKGVQLGFKIPEDEEPAGREPATAEDSMLEAPEGEPAAVPEAE